MFRISKWLEDNLPSFEYFRKITLTTYLQKARRGRDSLPLSLLIWYNTPATWIATSTIQIHGNYHHFFIQITIPGHVLVHSVYETHVLAVTVKLIWLMFLDIYFHKKLFKSHYCRSNQLLSKLHCSFAWCALFKVATFF